MPSNRNKFLPRKKQKPIRSDSIFWDNVSKRRPSLSRHLLKLMRHTEFVRAEGNGYLLRVTKDMQVFKRGVYYMVCESSSNLVCVARKDALVRVNIKADSLIFFYPEQGKENNRFLKLRSNAASILSVRDLNNPERKLGFAVSLYAKDATNEQTAYIPGKSLRFRMRGFKNECGSGFHFYLFASEVNRLFKN